ncbi:MAG: hypothetical protein QM673_05165 [Gordonia sp. (in: high G+C Gram-positive bacteria)]
MTPAEKPERDRHIFAAERVITGKLRTELRDVAAALSKLADALDKS